MKRYKPEQIVAFSELEKIIHTPVKHYSSSMHVRLAFAVVAHLEPEILLVDRVLAVGDIRFKKKCCGKMGDVARAGRTVILVTHQLNQIHRLCQRVAWIDGGSLRQMGATSEVVAAYEAYRSSIGLEGVRPSQGRAQSLRWRLLGSNRSSDYILPSDGETSVGFILRVNQPLHGVRRGINLHDQHRHSLLGNTIDGVPLEPSMYEFCSTHPSLPLRPSPYSWRTVIYDAGEPVDDWECVPQMQVITLPITHYRDESAGFLNIRSKLEIAHKASFK